MNSSTASLALPKVFADHMVLQRGIEIPVWGFAKADARVEVTLQFKTKKELKTTKASADGHWMVHLPAQEPGLKCELIVASCDHCLRFKDVLIGDVWFCFGQSNMLMKLQESKKSEQEFFDTHKEEVRFTTVKENVSLSPEWDCEFEGNGWALSSPESNMSLSAVACHFSHKLNENLGIPIGVIVAARGGSFIESWIEEQSLADEEAFRPILDRWQYLMDKREKFTAEYNQVKAVWDKLYMHEYLSWVANIPHNPIPFKYKAPTPVPEKPSHLYPGSIYNAMVTPIIQYGAKGVVWYQGESNSDRAWQYRHLLKVFLRNLRNKACKKDLPAIVIQLPNFNTDVNIYAPKDGGPWHVLRESQELAEALPNTWTVCTIDLGDSFDIHPLSKAPIADRVYKMAMNKVYLKAEIISSSPSVLKVTQEKNILRITFSECESLQANQEELSLKIAGQDQRFMPAKFSISGNTVDVWHDSISNPVAVRYAWEEDPRGLLFGDSGLPVYPFRTDSWRVETQDKFIPFDWLESEYNH